MTQGDGWRVGEFTITPIMESDSAFSPDFLARILLPEAQPEALKAMPWLQPHWVDETWGMRFVTQSLLVRGPAGVGLVDTCLGNDKTRRNPCFHQLQTPWLERLAEAGVRPEDVDWVLCTHLHMDHVGWNTRWLAGRWVPTFPRARYLFVDQEWAHTHAEGKSGYFLSDSVAPLVEAGLVELVPSHAEIGPGLELVATPGHTVGHVSLRIQSLGQEAWISGDALHHPCQVGRPTWSSRADTDPIQAAQTRVSLLKQVYETQALLVGTHFAPPAAGHVLADEAAVDRWRFEPAPPDQK